MHWTFCGQKCLLPISQSLVLPGIIVAWGLKIIVHIAECDMRVDYFVAKVRLMMKALPYVTAFLRILEFTVRDILVFLLQSMHCHRLSKASGER